MENTTNLDWLADLGSARDAGPFGAKAASQAALLRAGLPLSLIHI